MPDLLQLEVRDVVTHVLTGIYSEETKRPQPLSISVVADLVLPEAPFAPDTPLARSKDYMDIRQLILEGCGGGVHFALVEAVAEHLCNRLFAQDERVLGVDVRIVKLAISPRERIGIRLRRRRPAGLPGLADRPAPSA